MDETIKVKQCGCGKKFAVIVTGYESPWEDLCRMCELAAHTPEAGELAALREGLGAEQ